MIEELADVLEQNWKFVNERTGPDFVAHLIGFLSTLRADSRTGAILEELGCEERESIGRLAAAKRTAEASMRELIPLMDSLIVSDGSDLPSATVLPYLDGTLRVKNPERVVICGLRGYAEDFFKRTCTRVEAAISSGADPDDMLKKDIDAGHILKNRIDAIDSVYSHAVHFVMEAICFSVGSPPCAAVPWAASSALSRRTSP